MGRFKSLFFCLCLLVVSPTSYAAYSTVAQIAHIDTTIDWIWSGGRAPTGNSSYFYGHQLGFYNANSTNGADRSYGYFLQYTYDMYCRSKSLPLYCLGSHLRVGFSISGPNVNNKVMMVNISGVTTVSNYFQQIRSAMFAGLERAGGTSPISQADRALIQPKPRGHVATEFKIVTNALGQGNNIWKGTFPTDMLNTMNDRIGNVLTFQSDYRSLLQSDTYFSYSQERLTDAFQNRGTSGRVTAIVSAPSARDSFGRAYVQSSSAPIFIMNNCANYGVYSAKFAAGSFQDQGCTGVGIFLHELGHQMGLSHCVAGSTRVCTDNIASTTAGRQFLVNHITTRTSAMRFAYDY